MAGDDERARAGGYRHRGPLGLSVSFLPAFVAIGFVAGVGLGLVFDYLDLISKAVVPARLAGATSGTA